MSTISGLKKISSTSSEGLSTVMMEFNLGTNIDVASSDVRSKLDALRNTLPQDAKAPVVNKLDVKALPVIQINMASDRRSSIDVRRLADDFLKDRLSQLPGVADVTVSGGDVREIQVNVDKSRLEAYKLSIDQVVSALKNENLNLPSGTIEEARRDYAVRMMGEFTDPAQILNVRIPIAGNPNLCVRDIAEVAGHRGRSPPPTPAWTADPSVTLVVQKQSDANTVKVVDNVRAELEELTGQPFTDASLAKQAGNKAAAPAQTGAPAGNNCRRISISPPRTINRSSSKTRCMTCMSRSVSKARCWRCSSSSSSCIACAAPSSSRWPFPPR